MSGYSHNANTYMMESLSFAVTQVKSYLCTIHNLCYATIQVKLRSHRGA